MSRYLLIEETTDRDNPEVEIKTTGSLWAVRRWLSKPADFAWPGAARNDLPIAQQNFHRRVRYAYRLRPRFRVKKSDIEREYRMANFRNLATAELRAWLIGADRRCTLNKGNVFEGPM